MHPELAMVHEGLSYSICGEKKGATTMLLCSTCKQGWHMTCLIPPLISLPLGDWICPRCRRPLGHATSSSKRCLYIEGKFIIFMTITLSFFVIGRQPYNKEKFDRWIAKKTDNKKFQRRLMMGQHICTQPTSLVVIFISS